MKPALTLLTALLLAPLAALQAADAPSLEPPQQMGKPLRKTNTGTLSAPGRLRCEYLVEPLGIDVPRPRLSWQLTTRVASERGQRQTA